MAVSENELAIFAYNAYRPSAENGIDVPTWARNDDLSVPDRGAGFDASGISGHRCIEIFGRSQVHFGSHQSRFAGCFRCEEEALRRMIQPTQRPTMSTGLQVGRTVGCVTAFLSVLAVSSCGFLFGYQERSWSEDVKLDDGSVVTIERYVKFEESNSWSKDAYSAKDVKATLAFAGKLADLPVWDFALTPIVLYRDGISGDWVIVAESTACEVWVARGKPNPPYWEFRLGNVGWREQSVSPVSINRSSNLFTRYHMKLAQKHYGIDDKAKIGADRVVPRRASYCGHNFPQQSDSAATTTDSE